MGLGCAHLAICPGNGIATHRKFTANRTPGIHLHHIHGERDRIAIHGTKTAGFRSKAITRKEGTESVCAEMVASGERQSHEKGRNDGAAGERPDQRRNERNNRTIDDSKP